jgi:hypothetical protein
MEGVFVSWLERQDVPHVTWKLAPDGSRWIAFLEAWDAACDGTIDSVMEYMLLLHNVGRLSRMFVESTHWDRLPDRSCYMLYRANVPDWVMQQVPVELVPKTVFLM